MSPILRHTYIAFFAMKYFSQGRFPSLGSNDPGATCPWWGVSHMLSVSAIKFGNPMTLIVLMESNDATLHESLRA